MKIKCVTIIKLKWKSQMRKFKILCTHKHTVYGVALETGEMIDSLILIRKHLLCAKVSLRIFDSLKRKVTFFLVLSIWCFMWLHKNRNAIFFPFSIFCTVSVTWQFMSVRFGIFHVWEVYMFSFWTEVCMPASVYETLSTLFSCKHFICMLFKR